MRSAPNPPLCIQKRYYKQFINAVNNIGGLTEKQLYQFQLFCQSILASQRHKLVINDLEDKYFRPSKLPPIKDDFPILNVTALKHPELIFTRHLADALSLIPTIESLITQELAQHNDTRSPKDIRLNIVDIGSGGGIPGLAVAIARPNWSVTTVDSVAKKSVFMRHVIDYLGLQNATTAAGRAEALAVPGVSSPLIGATSSFDASLHNGDPSKYNIFVHPQNSVYDRETIILAEDGVSTLSAPPHHSNTTLTQSDAPNTTSPSASLSTSAGIGHMAAQLLQKPYDPAAQPTQMRMHEGFTVVVARGVTNMPELLGFCAPFVKKNGWFIAQKAAQIHKVLNDDGSETTEDGGRSEIPADVSEIRNKGEQVRLMAKLHASNPHFRDSLVKILKDGYNPGGAPSADYDNISHEIMVRSMLE